MGLALLLIVVFFILLLSGLPAAFAMGLSTIVYFVFDRGLSEIPLDVIASNMISGVNSFQLMIIPLFYLLGHIMNESKIGERIFDFANALVGHFRGGLGIVNVLVSMMFAGMSGSGSADAAGLGQLEIKAMRDRGYDDKYSVGVTAGSSLIGPIIPPSIAGVLFAIMAGESVTDILIAGLIPGILMGIFMIILAIILVPPNYEKQEKSSLYVVWSTFKRAFLPMLTPVILLGGILSGIFTATESAAVASIYAIVLSCIIYRSLSLKGLWNVIKHVSIASSSIMFILASAHVFSWVLTRSRIPMETAELISEIAPNAVIALLLIGIFLIVIGCFLPVAASIVIAVPILVPVAADFGIDPLAFGIFVILLLVVGEATPPFGMVLFIIAKISKVPYLKVARSVIPFLLVVIAVAILVVIFPALANLLPSFIST